MSKNKILVKSIGLRYPELIISSKYKKVVADITAEIITTIFFKFKCEYNVNAINNRIEKYRVGV